MQFGVNHLGHFLLTNLLLDRIKEAPAGRIINISSSGYKSVKNGLDFDNINNDDPKRIESRGPPSIAYMESKLANILFTQSLSKRLQGSCVTTNSLHPGFVIPRDPRKLDEMELSFVEKVHYGPDSLKWIPPYS